MMDRYIDVMRQPESKQKWTQTNDLLEELCEDIRVRPARQGQAVGIVTDDQGRPLSGVEIAIRWYGPDSLADREGRPAATRTALVDWQFSVSMDGFPKMVVQFRKPGYTDAGWAIEKGRGYEGMQGARGYLDSSDRSYVEPRSDGGPGVHVVMYAAHYEWNPPGDGDFFQPDRKYWPKVVAGDCPVLVRSDAPQFIAVSETGTYVATDATGNVVQLVRLRRGRQIGFGAELQRGRKVVIWYVGNSSGFPVEKGPYEWRLYSIAKPIYPATQPSAPAADKNERPAVIEPPASRPALIPALPSNLRLAAIRASQAQAEAEAFRRAIEQTRGLSGEDRRQLLKAVDEWKGRIEDVSGRIRRDELVGDDEAMALTLGLSAQPEIGDLLKNKPEVHQYSSEIVLRAAVLPALASGWVLRPDAMRPILVDRLGCTPEQMQKLDALQERHAAEAQAIVDRTPKRKSDGQEYFFASQQLAADMMVLGYRLASELESILTQEQLNMVSSGALSKPSK